MLLFESGDTGVFKTDRNKLFANNKRLIDNHTLILDMLHSYMSVVCTHHCRGVFKKVFFFTQGNLQGGRVKEHRMMFTLHLYLLQLYIQAVLYLITWCLLPFSPLYQNAYSPYCSLYISECAGKENLFNNQEVLQLIIISFTLMTLMCDSGVILKGEIRC